MGNIQSYFKIPIEGVSLSSRMKCTYVCHRNFKRNRVVYHMLSFICTSWQHFMVGRISMLEVWKLRPREMITQTINDNFKIWKLYSKSHLTISGLIGFFGKFILLEAFLIIIFLSIICIFFFLSMVMDNVGYYYNMLMVKSLFRCL